MKNKDYTIFIKSCLLAGFTDDQTNILSEIIQRIEKIESQALPIETQLRKLHRELAEQLKENKDEPKPDQNIEKLRLEWRGHVLVDDSFEDLGIKLNADKIADWWIDKIKSLK